MNTLRLDTVDSKLDYIVDDLPLWDWIALVTGDDVFRGRRSSTPFGSPMRKRSQRAFYEMLMGKRPSDVGSGRVALYVCECCADYGCGFTSVVLGRQAGIVRWSDFAPHSPENILSDVPTIVFDETLYRSALSVVA